MKVGLLGIDFHSNNRGCGALGYAAVNILSNICDERKDMLEIYAILHISDPIPVIEGKNILFHCYKIYPKKYSFWKECKTVFNQCDIILDFTGGDSFSDIYGMKRFVLGSIIKEIAIKSKAKFIMAPQTIGPFTTKFVKRWAKRILKKSEFVFVRDTISAQYTKETFGVDAILTTDVAFELPYKQKEKSYNYKKIIGFNPSGLLWSGIKNFTVSKHITVDYVQYIKSIMDVWCNNKQYEVHLIPHVFTYDGLGGENDMRACMDIHEMYPDTIIESSFNTPMEIKSFISTMDIFIGARMHATIAAFSTGVATIPFSYSRKFEGLYRDLNYPYLIGATNMSTEDAIQKTLMWVEESDTLEQQVFAARDLLVSKRRKFYDILMNL